MMLAYHSAHAKQLAKRAAARIVPKLLNFEQKQHHMDIAQDMLTTFNDDFDFNWYRIVDVEL